MNEQKKRKYTLVIKNLFLIIVPFCIPFILEIPDRYMSIEVRWILVLIASCILIFRVVKYSLQEESEMEKLRMQEYDNNRYRISQRALNRINHVIQIKGDLLKDETYKVHYDYKENVLLYNSHRYIERLCENLLSLISEISDIDLQYIRVTFIYRYPLEEGGWQWITGKEPTGTKSLDTLISEKTSFFHYLISENMAYYFTNDKAELIPRHYIPGDLDTKYPAFGSITSHKVTFRNNNDIFVKDI
ncbi:MAG: hypothetical protein Q4F24_18020 [Eubacteriales bacterium]|nr:hypothetical protein [Eubacteriales bacterium]